MSEPIIPIPYLDEIPAGKRDAYADTLRQLSCLFPAAPEVIEAALLLDRLFRLHPQTVSNEQFAAVLATLVSAEHVNVSLWRDRYVALRETALSPQ